MELTLYYFDQCPFCQKVLSFLESIKKTIPQKDLLEAAFREELMTIGGKTQVPCLVIDGKALYESADIIEWIDANQDLLKSL